MQTPPRYRPVVHAVAALTTLVLVVLVAVGGTVTSHDAGMAVPDGFTTFGHWSLTAPLATWWHDFGTWIEHSHRLVGYVAGWCAIALAVVLVVTQKGRPWLRWSGVALLLGVIGQGILGILRVDQISYTLAGIHGVTGQMLLWFAFLIALASGPWWVRRLRAGRRFEGRRVPVLAWSVLVLLLFQLGLGSAVRHSQSAMAIPDWPLHYGSVLPPMSQPAVDATAAEVLANAGAGGGVDLGPQRLAAYDPDGDGTYAAWQVHLQLTHRIGAYVTTAVIATFIVLWWTRVPAARVVLGGMGVLLTLQVTLGVATIWSGESATYATLHQTCGALLGLAAVASLVRVTLGERLEVPAPRGTASAAAHSAEPRNTGLRVPA